MAAINIKIMDCEDETLKNLVVSYTYDIETELIESFLIESFEIEMLSALRCNVNDRKTISIETKNFEQLEMIKQNVMNLFFEQNNTPKINLN